MISDKLHKLLTEYSHDTFNYFSRTALRLSDETRLDVVLRSPNFNVSKPILYVLYGTESQLIKVGKTKSSNQRLSSYLASQGKPSNGNNFRKDDTIHLIGYYLLPDFDYNKQEYARFMSDCERLLINNAKQLFGKTVYSKEWFSYKHDIQIMMSKLPKLFYNLNYVVDDSMYHISISPFELAQNKHKTLETSIHNDSNVNNRDINNQDNIWYFANYCHDNNLLGSHIPTKLYYLMYVSWCDGIVKPYNIETVKQFGKKFINILTTYFGYTNTHDRLRLSSFNELMTPVYYINALFPNLDLSAVGQSYCVVNFDKIIDKSTITDDVKTYITTIDSLNVLTETELFQLSYLANNLHNFAATSCLLKFKPELYEQKLAMSLTTNELLTKFVKFCDDNGFFYNPYLTNNLLYKLYQYFESENTISRINPIVFGREIANYLKNYGYVQSSDKSNNYPEKVIIGHLNSLELDVKDFDTYITLTNNDLTVQQRYYINPTLHHEIESTDYFSKIKQIEQLIKSDSNSIDLEDITTIRILKYLAYDKQSSLAQSLLTN